MQKTAATIFVCSKCDAQSPKWSGQCLECGSWGTVGPARPEWSGANQPARQSPTATPSAKPAAVTSLDAVESQSGRRISTGIGELDRVLGGGLMAGSVTLLGGEPGIGKSTLAMMLAVEVAKREKSKAAYFSGEESAGQVKQRCDRLNLKACDLMFSGETGVGAMIAAMEKSRPAVAVIDSIQTVFAEDIPTEAGAQNQVRGAAAKLMSFAKRSGVPLVIIGHVTKDGQVAGPKTLEHLVDTVLSFEGERSGNLRLLRGLKNRFGSTDETGVFGMEGDGLKEIHNPSAYLLDERRPGLAGSAVCCVMEGNRPMLVEIQALTNKTSFGYPTRRASGFDQSRLEMLLAVLAKRGGIDLGQHDVFVNVVGGLKIKEPAADLAVIATLASSAKNSPLPEGLTVWGEVGLGGEVRSAAAVERRLAETAALGLKSVMTALPRSGRVKSPGGMKVADIRTVREAIEKV